MSGPLFVDTNVFIATLTDEPQRGAVATALLDGSRTLATSTLVLMELRTVLAKKKRVEQSRVEETLADLREDLLVFPPAIQDVVNAESLQQETLLYPMDALLLAQAQRRDWPFVTFDGELLANGAVPLDEFI
ncbi:type II toxin-antitoxin system VapC family toxin [Halomarina pelagica]|uniref:type II toxin-antitoxin system VapC family toxin n=1 Tax=Halomarina pelagica TaxID=2961599 RepID=UPI0020C1D337|nr:PIN domain-containing protein [Halomarina sp. BND7]